MKAGLLCLSAILVGASALPSSRSLEEDGQSKHDDGRYLSHKPLLSSRSAPQCANLSVAEAKNHECTLSLRMIAALTARSVVPGWDAIEAYAKSQWGSGSWNIVTNPADYSDRPAHVCVSDDPVKIELDGDPQCQDSTIDNVSGTSGTDGSVAAMGLSIQSRRVFEPFTCLVAVSKLALSATLGVSFGVPLLSADASATVEQDVTNKQSSSFGTSYFDVVEVTRTIDTKDGKNCSVDLKLHSCTAKSKGQIRYVANGFIWFNYNDRTKGHYKWSVKIEDVVKNDDDRSSIAEIEGPISSETHSTSDAACKDS
ncbi:hypothetical protein IW261DRAFT_1641006 [Armillaria novae-zelandiae]|uniref:Ecp2 effector protein domain-containing protein n=1 Tax=Armillaria novae-zelandiae TaxID=153914 RepID=A0AA39THL1_9AGAR|nr:hypothetical protein IW261DRAFT_1641006 [Armillaria novae-zelandiae]